MFKSFQNQTRSGSQFKGFPNLFTINNQAYGFRGCEFWLDASFGLDQNNDLGAVGNWVDKIKNIRFSQATAGNQPRFIAANVNYNNLPTVEFHDSARRMNSNIIIPSLKKGGAVAIVANYNSITSTNCIIGVSSGNSSNIWLGGSDVLVTGVGFNAGNSVLRNAAGTESTDPKIMIIGTNLIYVDGVSYSITEADSFLYAWDQIGATLSNTIFALIGNIAEIIIYESLSSSNFPSLSANINSRYALY